MAARATAALRVSIEIGRPVNARIEAITGAVRAISSASGTSAAPGRVDSPPISRIATPAATICCAAASAASWA